MQLTAEALKDVLNPVTGEHERKTNIFKKYIFYISDPTIRNLKLAEYLNENSKLRSQHRR